MHRKMEERASEKTATAVEWTAIPPTEMMAEALRPGPGRYGPSGVTPNGLSGRYFASR